MEDTITDAGVTRGKPLQDEREASDMGGAPPGQEVDRVRSLNDDGKLRATHLAARHGGGAETARAHRDPARHALRVHHAQGAAAPARRDQLAGRRVADAALRGLRGRCRQGKRWQRHGRCHARRCLVDACADGKGLSRAWISA
jgi:hypothetical protein